MRIALAQINSLLGAFEYNRLKVQEYAQRAKDKHCELVVFPECALLGYHPMDLLERPSIIREQFKELKLLKKNLPSGIAVLVGLISQNENKKGKPFRNSAVLLQKGKKDLWFHKELLPTYDVFDEARHIEQGSSAQNIFLFHGKKVLVTICEDIWAWPRSKKGESPYRENPLKKIAKNKVDLVLNLSASPFTSTKYEKRLSMCRQTLGHFGTPMVYVNMVGGQDELIFDGGSMAFDKKGKLIAQCLRFEEDLNVVDFSSHEGGLRKNSKSKIELTQKALVLGLRDFVSKTGFSKVHLGLSGGVDSALVACLAADALGPQNVTGIALPSQFNDPLSEKLARELASHLGIKYLSIPIQKSYETLLKEFSRVTSHQDFNLVNENIQARIRGLLLMAYSNKENSLLLATSNKSELAMGYSTLYGDMTGALMVIGDLLKTEVYKMCDYYNQQGELIPQEILTRAPSAELRPNQKDSDSLPEYSILDQSVEALVAQCRSPKNAIDKKVLQSMMKTEFKRWQAPPILKLTDHAFGRGRRLPIAHKAFF